ncbi:indole-3-glycerol phosphate synthase [Nonlabens sp. Hel1_33_55]|uniref:indole-3-glycerol phosphate synthase TrpC n=1 Tax=Nonlabens sp. Hel1_33_55 TaxID=1336802 RepID=UPI000875BD19|nr:indole-3-glycerol phosphate synthase TrpC [Nonlabens sp. Hel1_33_55]SCY22940.1 indole-3-glycerol phosphate synthase [Nonlabens sp. Hel1_33_55]
MEDILKKITDKTYADLKIRKEIRTLSDLREMPHYTRETISMHDALKNGSGIIAEHKRQSPSKGSFKCPATLEQVVKGYENAGASAISCLTDEPFFGGTLQDLLDTRDCVDIPILRKDFMVDLYQIHEARAFGADAILLIASCLNDEELKTMANEAINLDLDILFEVHDLEELNRVKKVVQDFKTSTYLIGVNNRDLKKFKTDIQISKDLLEHFPKKALAISESGISDPEVVRELQDLGYRGFLIGENFMKTNDPGRTCAKFIKQTTL